MQKYYKRHKGALTIEAALVFPVMLTFVICTAFFMLAWHYQRQVYNASHEAAQIAQLVAPIASISAASTGQSITCYSPDDVIVYCDNGLTANDTSFWQILAAAQHMLSGVKAHNLSVGYAVQLTNNTSNPSEYLTLVTVKINGMNYFRYVPGLSQLAISPAQVSVVQRSV